MQVLQSEMEKCFAIGNKTETQLNEVFLAKNKDSLLHVMEAAKLMAQLEPKRKAEALKLVTEFDSSRLRLEVLISLFFPLITMAN